MNTRMPQTACASSESLGEATCNHLALGEKIMGGLKRTRMRADALQDGVTRKARKAVTHADEAVHHHPYRAMGIAAGAALLVGLFLAARR
jgi:ElaB/YqjD/DUF883 family membrane-anchored ribosome-binding protein